MAIGPNYANMRPTVMPARPGGCGMHGGGMALPGPKGAFAGAAFAIPRRVGAPAEDAERFVSSSMGGVIVGADGAPAGRVPEGSFVDTKDGAIYGPDSKPIALPEGATVDFFDLPDVKTLVARANSLDAAIGGGGAQSAVAGTTAAGPTSSKDGTTAGGPTSSKDGTTASGSGSSSGSSSGATGEMETAVDGQWGPGGVTPIKAGGTAPIKGGGVTQAEDCGMDHAGATGSLMDQVQRLVGSPAIGGGFTAAVGGANGLGTIPSLEASLMELIQTLRQLTAALQTTTTRGGSPEQGTPEPPAKAVETPPSTETPSTETPTTETTGAGAAKDEKATTDSTTTSTEPSIEPASATTTT